MIDNEITDVEVKTETPKPKRTRRKFDPADQMTLPAIPTVEVADLEPQTMRTPEEYVFDCIRAAKLDKLIAEVHAPTEQDGTVRHVEFRGALGITFVVPQIGEVKWVMFTGKITGFPEFLQNLKVVNTVSP